MSAASTRPATRPSGTTTSAPRPEARVAATALAISWGQCGPGSAVHTARGAPPSASALRNAGPCSYRSQLPADGAAGGGSGSGEALASALPFLGGTASCSTSARLPAYLSATARDRASSSGPSTGSGDTT